MPLLEVDEPQEQLGLGTVEALRMLGEEAIDQFLGVVGTLEHQCGEHLAVGSVLPL